MFLVLSFFLSLFDSQYFSESILVANFEYNQYYYIKNIYILFSLYDDHDFHRRRSRRLRYFII